jgi:phosphatidate cytidylyltransferase
VKRNLLLRIVAGVIFLPVLFLLVSRGGSAYTALLFVIVLLGSWEWWRLGRQMHGAADLVLVVAGTLGAFQGGLDPRAERLPAFLALFLLLSLLVSLRHRDGRSQLAMGHLLLGMLYVGLLPAFLVRMRGLAHGREALFLTYATVFICDTAAYSVGRLLGRRALWKRISPKKTWEGAVGGLLGAVGAALLGRVLFAGFLSPGGAVGFGVIVGVLGQFGDLVESLWKRDAGVKDSSGLIPGHGGVLDRFDNLHFVAPVLYTYLTLFS